MKTLLKKCLLTLLLFVTVIYFECSDIGHDDDDDDNDADSFGGGVDQEFLGISVILFKAMHG